MNQVWCRFTAGNQDVCVCVCVVFSFILQLWHNNNWDTRDVWFVFIRKKKKIHKLKSNVQSFVPALQRHLLGPLLDTFRAVVFKTRVNPAPYFDHHCFNELFRKTDNKKVQQLRWNNRVCRFQRSLQFRFQWILEYSQMETKNQNRRRAESAEFYCRCWEMTFSE